MDFFGIGAGELVLVLIIALIIFGPGRLPEFARGLGRAVRELSRYSSALTKDFREEFEKELREAPEVAEGKPSGDKETPSASGATGIKDVPGPGRGA